MRQKLIATFDIGDKTIDCLGRASAAVELAARKQLRLGCRASTWRALRCKPSLDATHAMALTACRCRRGHRDCPGRC